MKADYEEKIKETLADNESRFQHQQREHRAQLEALTTELDEWKHRSSTIKSDVVETATEPAGEQLGQLKDEIYITSSQALLKPTEGLLSQTPQSTGITPLYVPNTLPSPLPHQR